MAKRRITRWLASMVVGLLVPATAAAQASHNSYVVLTGGSSIEALTAAVSSAGGTLGRVHSAIGMATARSDDPSFAVRLSAAGAVQGVSRDLLISQGPISFDLAGQQTAMVDGVNHFVQFPPQSAFFYGLQWNLLQIDARGAWDAGQFGEGVKVAVLDSGTDPGHLDLLHKVDLVQSANFLSPGTSPCGPPDEGTSPITGNPLVDRIADLNGHGTLVSGGVTTNNFGTAGVAPLATVVAVKVLNCGTIGSAPSGLISDVIAGLVYAASLADVQVINMSLGAAFDRSDLHALAAIDPTLSPAVILGLLNRAVNLGASMGKLVVVGAGNGAIDLDHDQDQIIVPAESGSAVSVYATNENDWLASYSNHGRSGTWLGAPGGQVVGVLGPCSRFISVGGGFPCASGIAYVYAAGTSFAAPALSGVAALVQGKFGGILSPGRVKTILSNTADDLGATGVDNLFSHGRVNASKAIGQ